MTYLSVLVLKWPLQIVSTLLLLFLSFSVNAWAQLGALESISIRVIEGQNAINNITRQTAYEPVIEVQDNAGRPVAGATVTFLLPAIGPGGAFTDGSKTLMLQTDEDGRAAGRGLRPNNQVGQFEIRITASHQGKTANATITQTNAAPAAAGTKSGRKLAILLGVIGGGAAAAAIAVAGGGGGGQTSRAPTPPPVGDTPSGTVTPGTPGFGPPQ
jgi:hypothetical protein